MPCGISSLLVQVTVVPAFTVTDPGVKKKLSIVTVFGVPSARANRTPPANTEPTAAPSKEQAIIGRNIFVLLVFLDFCQLSGLVLSLAAASRRWRAAARSA